MQINYVLSGTGKPLLLIHGLGSSWRSWQTVMKPLAAQRAVVAIDLPGFGKSAPLVGEVTVRTMANAITQFLREHDLTGTDAAGCSLGARLVLELARRGNVIGRAVSLGPGGFWPEAGWERHAYRASLCMAARMARTLHFAMPMLTDSEHGRRLLMRAFSAQAGTLAPALVLEEMRSFASAASFQLMLRDLVRGVPQEGAEKGSLAKSLVIGWGRLDRLCHPRQSVRALELFPDARLHWFERCGHLPHWDAPDETARLILDSTSD